MLVLGCVRVRVRVLNDELRVAHCGHPKVVPKFLCKGPILMCFAT